MRKIAIEVFTVLEDKFLVELHRIYLTKSSCQELFALFLLPTLMENIGICKGQNRSTYTIAMKESLFQKYILYGHDRIKY